MSNLVNISNQSIIKSTELVDIINEFRKAEGKEAELRHNDFMTKIRKEIETLKNLGLEGERNFSQSSYTNSQNKAQPCYELNRDGMLQMLNSESTYVRFKTIEYINKLEEKIIQPKPTCIEDVLIQSLQEMKDMRLQLAQTNTKANEAKKEATEAKKEIEGMREVMTLNPNSWRNEVSNILNKIAKERGGTQEAYREIRNQSYKLLDERAGAKLEIRLTNRRRKVLEETGSKSKADKVSKLDVIADDKRLTEIYLAIVKEMAIKYKVA